MLFEPTKESLSRHKIPDWYEDAKVGIFIHWSLFSVPAFAPVSESHMMELTVNDYTKAMKYSPYAEWYLNAIRIPGSPAAVYHAKQYGEGFEYFSFQTEFEKSAKHMNPNDWATLFAQFGAKYVIMVTKHHDGYLLWPSKYKNSMLNAYQATRDYVGEVTQAVRKNGMKMGLYYSGILDWSFKQYPMLDLVSTLKHYVVEDNYAEYATKHWYELMEKYEPSVLWNDIAYPVQIDLKQLFAKYYNTVLDGVVNDRWEQFELPDLYQDSKERSILWEKLEKEGFSPFLETTCLHDFSTPEYAVFSEKREKKWESTRGVGKSFGYNATEIQADMLTGKELIHMVADVVSKNGNLLINVGPMPDGRIPEMQIIPLQIMGEWLKRNGEAIYGTRCAKQVMGVTADNKEVRYTQKGTTLYCIILSDCLEENTTIQGLSLLQNTAVSLLGASNPLRWKNEADNVAIHVQGGAMGQDAYVLRIENKGKV